MGAIVLYSLFPSALTSEPEEGLLPYQRRIREASREDLEATILAMAAHLYHDGPDTAWEGDTIESVAGVLIDAGFTPRRGESK